MSSYHGWTHAPKSQGGTDPIPGLGEIPWARVSKGYDASNQSISNNSFTDLTFNHEYNAGAGESGEDYFDTTTDGIEVLVAGLYLVTCEVNWFDAMGTTAWLMGPVCTAPTDDYNKLDAKGASSSTTMTGIVTVPMRLPVNQFLKLQVWQITGSSKNVDVCFLEVAYMGSYTGTERADMNPIA